MKIYFFVFALLISIMGCSKEVVTISPQPTPKPQVQNLTIPEDFHYYSQWLIEMNDLDVLIEVVAICVFTEPDACDLREIGRVSQNDRTIYVVTETPQNSLVTRWHDGRISKNFVINSWSSKVEANQETPFEETSYKTEAELESLYESTEQEFFELKSSLGPNAVRKDLIQAGDLERYHLGRAMEQDFQTRRCRDTSLYQEIRSTCEAKKGNILLNNDGVFLSDILTKYWSPVVELDGATGQLTSVAFILTHSDNGRLPRRIEILKLDQKSSSQIVPGLGEKVLNAVNPRRRSLSNLHNLFCGMAYQILKDEYRNTNPYVPFYDSSIDQLASERLQERIDKDGWVDLMLSSQGMGEFFWSQAFSQLPYTIKHYFAHNMHKGGPCEDIQ